MDARHEFMKVAEVAQELRIARSRAHELIANGTIPAVKKNCAKLWQNSSALGALTRTHLCR